jgi:hypothetical protein
VRHQLSQEEHDNVVRGDTLVNFEGLSPADFIVVGLELEGIQYVSFIIEIGRIMKSDN